MGVFDRIAMAALALAVAGCGTIERARQAQAEVAGRGAGAAVGVADKVNLRGESLEGLVAFAMTNRPSVVSARLAVDDARLALRAIAADAPIASATPWTAPKLSLSGGYSESSAGTTLKGHDWRTRGDPSAALSLDLLIWDFGRYDARAKAQSEKVLAAETALVDEGYAVFGEVAAAYFTFLEKRALLEVAITNQAQYADHLSRAEERMKNGEANRLDVLRAKLDLANAVQGTVAASNIVATSGAALMNALGVDALHGTWEDAFGTNPSGTASVRRGFPYSSATVEEEFAFARTNAPSMRVMRAELRAASHSVDHAVADLMPEVSASVSLSWTDPLWYWKWGVSAAQSLFQGFRKTTAVDRAVVAMRKAAAALDDAEQDLSVDLETAIANRDNSSSAIRSAMASVRSSKENLDTVQEQVSVGAASRIELSEAIAAHSRAIGDCISAFYDGQRAEARIFRLVGRYPVYKEEIVEAVR